jgi:peptidyl-dipeptidase Dcp
MNSTISLRTKHLICLAVGTLALSAIAGPQAQTRTPNAAYGPSNPFYEQSTLPFEAPPFDKIKDSDYQPAMDAGIAQNLRQFNAIANSPSAPTFQNTLVTLERSGQLLDRVQGVFNEVTSANTDPTLQKVQEVEAPKLAALQDAEMLNPKLFARVKAIYDKRDSLNLDTDSKRLVERTYDNFIHAGANLSDADKTRLKEINKQLAALSTTFMEKLLAAAKAGAFATTDKSALAGLNDEQLASAQAAAKADEKQGYVIPLQNTTQQPLLTYLTNRQTREALFNSSWNRAEHGGDNDTRDTIAQMAKLRAEKGKLLGYPTFAAWEISDQMAKTPDAVLHFLDSLAPAATANANAEAKEIQSMIDSQHGGFALAPYDWNLYAEQVRKQKYGIDEAAVRPYFELNHVLQDGVFYAATQLYGITFKERHDIPVYSKDVRVFQVNDADGKPLALFYCDFFKRDNKQGGAWTDSMVTPSKLLSKLPVVYNVTNFAKPAPGQPALLTWDDVDTIFHEFGHALNGMFYSGEYPSLYSLGGDIPRDFVEFPSQFNEHWREDPTVFAHYARNYKTGAPMPADLVAKLRSSAKFNQGYDLTELLAAAELDMQWHILPADAPLQNPDAFEKSALEKTHLWLDTVPPRYRSSYFLHIWANGYEAGYYAYLWSEMLDDDAYAWFTEHGGLTRANGDRFRKMVLSVGRTDDMEALYESWRGAKPNPDALLHQRGLKP